MWHSPLEDVLTSPFRIISLDEHFDLLIHKIPNCLEICGDMNHFFNWRIVHGDKYQIGYTILIIVIKPEFITSADEIRFECLFTIQREFSDT